MSIRAFIQRDSLLSRKHHDYALNNPSEPGHCIYANNLLLSLLRGCFVGTFSGLSISILVHGIVGNWIHLRFPEIGLIFVWTSAIPLFVAQIDRKYVKRLHTIREYQRECWETENYLEGERNEMIAIYQQRYGLPCESATKLIQEMSLYPKLFVDHMMQVELGMLPPNSHETLSTVVIRAGSYTFGYILATLPFFWIGKNPYLNLAICTGQFSLLGLIQYQLQPVAGYAKRISTWIISAWSLAFASKCFFRHSSFLSSD